MFEITNLRQGAILNHHHGVEDEHGLTIKVEGISDLAAHVSVNGVPAVRDGRRFFADVTLTRKLNTITAQALTAFGEFTQSIQVVWDKKSFRRCNFYIDDHSFFWTDLAKERPRRAFDHFYLAGTLGESSREAQSGRRFLGTNGGALWRWCCLAQPGALGP